MVVRVRLRLVREPGRELTVSAIANAGFESDEHEIIVPTKVARGLGLYPRLPGETTIETYRGAGSRRFKVYRLERGLVKAWVVTEDRVVGPVDAMLTIVPREEDVLISDGAIDALRIVLVKPGEGLWKFIDEPPNILRQSV